MNSFFSFDPSKVLFNIQLAMSYTPRILENHITHRPYNGFLFVVRGAYTYSSQGESFTAHAGELIYLPAGSVPYSYFISDAGNGSVQTLQIEFALTDARSGSPLSFSDHPLLVSTIDKSSVKYAMKSVIAAHSTNKPSAHFLAASELLRIFALCAEGGHDEPYKNAERAASIALRYLEEHYTEPITAAELADLCHLSQSQLRRVFKAAVGMPPMSYKKHLLHTAARSLLRVGEFRVGEVAEMLGFYDIYAFSHFFTENEGISPSEYRRIARENE